MIVELETRLDCPPQLAVEEVKKTKLLSRVAWPVLKFIPREPDQLPETWEEGKFRTSLYLFGVLPVGDQFLVPSFPRTEGLFCMRDNGYSRLITKWDHTITIDPLGGATLYKDRIKVEAGLATPVVWSFVWLFFRHRQRRLRKLAAHQFRDDRHR